MGICAEICHEGDVFAVAVKVVGGDRGVAAVKNSARLRSEAIPHTGGAIAEAGGTLDLGGGRRGAYHEPCGQRLGELLWGRAKVGVFEHRRLLLRGRNQRSETNDPLR